MLFLIHYMADEGNLDILKKVAAEMPNSEDVQALLDLDYTRLEYIDRITIVINDVLGPHLKRGEKQI